MLDFCPSARWLRGRSSVQLLFIRMFPPGDSIFDCPIFFSRPPSTPLHFASYCVLRREHLPAVVIRASKQEGSPPGPVGFARRRAFRTHTSRTPPGPGARGGQGPETLRRPPAVEDSRHHISIWKWQLSRPLNDACTRCPCWGTSWMALAGKPREARSGDAGAADELLGHVLRPRFLRHPRFRAWWLHSGRPACPLGATGSPSLVPSWYRRPPMLG